MKSAILLVFFLAISLPASWAWGQPLRPYWAHSPQAHYQVPRSYSPLYSRFSTPYSLRPTRWASPSWAFPSLRSYSPFSSFYSEPVFGLGSGLSDWGFPSLRTQVPSFTGFGSPSHKKATPTGAVTYNGMSIQSANDKLIVGYPLRGDEEDIEAYVDEGDVLVLTFTVPAKGETESEGFFFKSVQEGGKVVESWKIKDSTVLEEKKKEEEQGEEESGEGESGEKEAGTEEQNHAERRVRVTKTISLQKGLFDKGSVKLAKNEGELIVRIYKLQSLDDGKSGEKSEVESEIENEVESQPESEPENVFGGEIESDEKEDSVGETAEALNKEKRKRPKLKVEDVEEKKVKVLDENAEDFEF